MVKVFRRIGSYHVLPWYLKDLFFHFETQRGRRRGCVEAQSKGNALEVSWPKLTVSDDTLSNGRVFASFSLFLLTLCLGERKLAIMPLLSVKMLSESITQRERDREIQAVASLCEKHLFIEVLMSMCKFRMRCKQIMSSCFLISQSSG